MVLPIFTPTSHGLFTPVFLPLAQTLEEMLRPGNANTIYYILKQFKANSRLEVRGSGFERGDRLVLKSNNLRQRHKVLLLKQPL